MLKIQNFPLLTEGSEIFLKINKFTYQKYYIENKWKVSKLQPWENIKFIRQIWRKFAFRNEKNWKWLIDTDNKNVNSVISVMAKKLINK